MGRRYLERRDTSAFHPPHRSHFSLTLSLYRYFGRAKELPGVKELFASKKKDEEEENLAANYYKKFLNHGPQYYGDLDEADGKLLEYEMRAEEQGMIEMSCLGRREVLRNADA